MIRILFDEGGSGHQDLFIKIDSMPFQVFISDSYWIFEMFGKKELSVNEIIICYIEFIKKMFVRMSDDEIFIPTEFYDQCIGGFMVSKTKRGLCVKVASTDSIDAMNIGILEQIDISKLKLTINGEWLMSLEGILMGLDWSIKRLKN